MNLGTIVQEHLPNVIYRVVESMLDFDDAGCQGDTVLGHIRSQICADHTYFSGINNAVYNGHWKFVVIFANLRCVKLNPVYMTNIYSITHDPRIVQYALTGYIPIEYVGAMRVALNSGDVASCRLMIAYGCVDPTLDGWVSISNDVSNVALATAALCGVRLNDTQKYNLMRFAITTGRTDVVASLSMSGWSKVSISDVYQCVADGRVDMFGTLYNTFAFVRAESVMLLRHACRNNAVEIVRYLMDRGHRSGYALTESGNSHLATVVNSYN